MNNNELMLKENMTKANNVVTAPSLDCKSKVGGGGTQLAIGLNKEKFILVNSMPCLPLLLTSVELIGEAQVYSDLFLQWCMQMAMF